MNRIQLTILASALELEVKHPKLRASSRWATMTVAKRYGYQGKQRKIDALAWCVEVMFANDIEVPEHYLVTLSNHGYELVA